MQEIIVGVASKPSKYFNDYVKCGEHDNRGVPLPSNHRIIIVCSKKLKGRSIIIWRKDNAQVRPDAIAIAEIILFSEPENWNTDDYGTKEGPSEYQSVFFLPIFTNQFTITFVFIPEHLFGALPVLFARESQSVLFAPIFRHLVIKMYVCM